MVTVSTHPSLLHKNMHLFVQLLCVVHVSTKLLLEHKHPHANMLDGCSDHRVILEMLRTDYNMTSSRNIAFSLSISAEFEKLFPFVNTSDIK